MTGSNNEQAWLNSFQSAVGPDVLEPFQNGYDGVLERLELGLDTALDDTPRCRCTLRVVSIHDGRETWSRIVVDFHRVDIARFELDALAGGGGVLYDGARLLHRQADATTVLDFDPGVAWKSAPAPQERRSRFLIAGKASIQLSAVTT